MFCTVRQGDPDVHVPPRLANIATFDVRELFDAESKLLPVADWPDSVRSCIRGFKPSEDGIAVTLESPLQALRTGAGDCRQGSRAGR
jgi:hypothetical protein